MNKAMSKMMMLAGMMSALLMAAPGDDVLMRAMKDELERSMKKLQLEKLQKPYFISYKIVDTETKAAAATFGALTESTDRRTRLLAVEVRVGDYARDNTNFFTMRFGPAGVVRVFADQGINTPLDDDYDEIRRQLWLATDSAYKQALDDYAKKTAVLANRNRTDDAPDFSKEAALKDEERPAAVAAKLEEASALVKELSGMFRTAKGIDNSAVRLTVTNTTTRFLNTEGTSYVRVAPLVHFNVSADTQAADGLPVTDSDSVYARSWAELPAKAALAERVNAIQKRLIGVREAKLVERYTGPVLFTGAAAAELMAQTLAPALVGLPRLVVEDQRFENVFGSDAGGLRERLGARILPAFLSVTDDASAKEFDGQALFGGYQVDEDGVRSRANVVVERGVFKSLLSSRALVAGASASTGNRRTAGTMPSNLLVRAANGVTEEELKQKLIAAVKERGLEYGILVKRMGNPTAPRPQNRMRMISVTIGGAGGGGGALQVEPVVEAYQVYPDGREVLVRNLGIAGMNLGNWKDVTAAANRATVYTGAYRNNRQNPFQLGAAIFTNTPLVSLAVPSMLFEELVLQRPVGEAPKTPFAGHPSFSN